MKRNSFIAAISAAVAATLSVGFVNITPKVIYGEDNRVDIYQLERADLRELAGSTVALIPQRSMYDTKKGNYTFKPSKFGYDRDLCSDEPFYDQPTAANCSGFLVGTDLVATAGHCIRSVADCQSYNFVFDYHMRSAGGAPMSANYDQVYGCKDVVARDYSSRQDYALIRLDRPVTDRRPLTLQTEKVNSGDELFVIGHPSGLPTKFADGAVVRSSNAAFFTANLDTFGGNSGSAVFNAASNEVVGILVRGESDFSYDDVRSCTISNPCPEGGCRGEDVTNISYISQALEKATAE